MAEVETTQILSNLKLKSKLPPRISQQTDLISVIGIKTKCNNRPSWTTSRCTRDPTHNKKRDK